MPSLQLSGILQAVKLTPPVHPVQALLPPDQLACLGNTLPQQLDELANLHTRMRSGQRCSTAALLIRPADLRTEGCTALDVSRSRISPTGSCACIFGYGADDTAQATALVGLDAAGVTWRCPLQPAVIGHVLSAAFDRSGKHCVVLSERTSAGLPQLCVSVFAVPQRRWLRGQRASGLLWQTGWGDTIGDVCLSHDGAAGAVLVRGSMLQVFGVQEPSCLSAPAFDVYAAQWAPNARSIVLLKPGSLAVLALDALAAVPSVLPWTLLPWSARPTLPNSETQLAFAPDSCVVWAAQLMQNTFSLALSLVAYSTEDGSRVGSEGLTLLPLSVTGGQILCLQASRAALAVSCGQESSFCTILYQRRQHVLGTSIVLEDSLCSLSFSSDGRWLAGYAPSRCLAIIESRTGRCLSRVMPASGPSCLAPGVRVAWNVCDPRQLHFKTRMRTAIKTGQEDSILVSTLQF